MAWACGQLRGVHLGRWVPDGQAGDSYSAVEQISWRIGLEGTAAQLVTLGDVFASGGWRSRPCGDSAAPGVTDGEYQLHRSGGPAAPNADSARLVVASPGYVTEHRSADYARRKRRTLAAPAGRLSLIVRTVTRRRVERVCLAKVQSRREGGDQAQRHFL